MLGEWETPFNHPIQQCVNATLPAFNPVHASLIPVDPANPSPNGWAGKVLVWDKSESTTACGSFNGNYGQRWAIVDPETGQVIHTDTFVIPAVDAPLAAGPVGGAGPNGFQGLFCSGHCWLRDGRLFVAGGDDWTQISAPTTGTNPNPAVQYGGSALICVFDPFVPVGVNPWSVLKNTPLVPIHLKDRRWYPTVVRLADANDTVLVVGGVETFDLAQNQVRPIELAHETYEAFQTYFLGNPGLIQRDTTTGAGGITVSSGRTLPAGFTLGLFAGPVIYEHPSSTTNNSFYYFPRLHLASRGTLGGPSGAVGINGRLWMAGMPTTSIWMDHLNNNMLYPITNPLIPIVSSGPDLLIEEPATVLLPNYPGAFKDIVVVMGGAQGGTHHDADITDKVWMLDTKAAAPSWFQSPTMNMKYRRKFHKAVLLPDTSILVIGGGQNAAHGVPAADNCVWPEVFLNTSWQYCAREGWWVADENQNMSWTDSPRTYHSSALLLPSGKVLSCGGDTRAFDYQVFRPHYWTDDPMDRPQFTSALPVSTLINYGAQFSFSFSVPGLQTLEKVVLTPPGSWTHAQGPGQRCVSLSFTASGTTATATAPPSSSDAPPGLYMLWLVSTTQTPSVATWVRLQ